MKKNKAKKEIPSEIKDDDYIESDQEMVSPSTPGAQSPKPEMSEEQQVFNDWLNDWFQRFQYYSSASEIANSGQSLIKNQELLILIGLAHNSDVLIAELRDTNKLLRDLLKSQED